MRHGEGRLELNAKPGSHAKPYIAAYWLFDRVDWRKYESDLRKDKLYTAYVNLFRDCKVYGRVNFVWKHIKDEKVRKREE